LGVACVLSLAIGSSSSLGMLDALHALFTGTGDAAAVVDARGTRTLVAVVVGASVAVSGAALQGLTRNPLADPGLLGVNAGASLAVVIGLTTGLAGNQLSFVLLALLGGSLAAFVVYAIASAAYGGAGPITLALTGAAVTAGCSSVTAALLMRDQGALDVFRFWQVGSVGGRERANLFVVLPFLLVGALVVFSSTRTLNALALGDDLARALGGRVALARLTVAAGAVLLACAATSIAGPIAFVGLLVPHLVRGFVGPDHARLLPLSALGGATMLTLADVAGRVVARPGELPAGILTALVGVPALIVLLRRKVVTL
jgi:iron complex transport system permease protein